MIAFGKKNQRWLLYHLMSIYYLINLLSNMYIFYKQNKSYLIQNLWYKIIKFYVAYAKSWMIVN